MNNVKDEIRAILRRSAIAINHVLIHSVAAAIVLVLLAATEKLLVLISGEPIRFFARTRFEFPVEWLFDAANIGILLGFLGSAIVSTYRTMRE